MFTSYEVICDHLNARSATDRLMLFTPDPYADEVDDLWNSELDERRDTDEEADPTVVWCGAWLHDVF